MKQRVAKRKSPERQGLALERVNEVTVILRVAVAGGAGASRRTVHQRARQLTVEPVTVETHLQAVATLAGRRAVQDAAPGERAATGHERLFLDEVSGTAFGQILQLRALNAKRRSVASVPAHHHLTDEFIVGHPVREVAMAPQHQSLVDRFLQISSEDSTLPFS